MFFTGFFHFCDTHDISLCAAQRFSRPQSLTTSHLSHSHSLRVTGYFNQCLVEFKMEIKDYLYILDKGEFDAEIDPFLSGKKKIGRFSNLSGIALQYLTIPTTSASAERRQKKQTNMSSVFLESQTLCRFNKKFHINPQSVFFFSVIEKSEYKEIQNRSLW